MISYVYKDEKNNQFNFVRPPHLHIANDDRDTPNVALIKNGTRTYPHSAKYRSYDVRIKVNQDNDLVS